MQHQSATMAVLALAAVSILALVLVSHHSATGNQIVHGTFYQEQLNLYEPSEYIAERKSCFHTVGRACCLQACNKRFNIPQKEKLSFGVDMQERDDCVYYCYWGINP